MHERLRERRNGKMFLIYDLKDFCVSVPQDDLWAALDWVAAALREKNKDWKDF